jgi:hypothetical protein
MDALFAQICHEFAFVVHRLRRVMLAAETRRKCILRLANEPTQDGLIGVIAPVSGSIIIRLVRAEVDPRSEKTAE